MTLCFLFNSILKGGGIHATPAYCIRWKSERLEGEEDPRKFSLVYNLVLYASESLGVISIIGKGNEGSFWG